MSLDKIKSEFNEVVKLINSEFGAGYAAKNPGLVQHLLDKIQQQEDRKVNKDIHKV